ncbi:hypothetical protein Pcaca05_18630 [Pectobacterium carotovorum subsp. carotovorum]|nr:hypothetical protein Pcaca05_18630 [Pectobacterium carotovorum subsp. carotovorum]
MKGRFKHTHVVPLRLKLLAWMNIGIQISFPIVAAFTPSIAAARGDDRFLQNQAQTVLQTRVYILGEGETASTIAQKYNMTLDALRKLNQFRIFSQGFDHLQQGDELDIPLAPLPEIQWDDASVAEDQANDTHAHKIASHAAQMGGALANGAGSDAMASMAQGIVSRAASDEIQQWLSRFGTARVQLETDKNFSLKNSQLDLLVPLFEQKDSLVFSQGSIHRTEGRAQANLGGGYRWFADDWMLGANTFLDYDLSRDHSRLGLGGEYWRNFLKLGANVYHRLTGWKTSLELKDYEERPANGWDVRMQAWVPSLPQLGGKLMYEQYYGNEVGLFGQDSRQRNPHAITAGVNYTPVPLLTFGAEQRQGQSGKSDTRFSMDMNYQLGVPWQQQINPDSVAIMRSLVGSRYDLVERNNNIVLEYRKKKEVILLRTADLVTGYASEQKPLGVSVTSKYGMERIDWSAPSLIAAGGKIVQDGNDWHVVVPEYSSVREGSNSYTVSGVAIDIKGNVSDRADTLIIVAHAEFDTSTSSLSPSSASLPANGVSQQKFVLKVNDKEGHPVDIAENEISVVSTSKPRSNINATVSAFTRLAAGEYEMTVTAGTVPESFTVTPSARNVQFASADVILTADNATALVDTLEVIEDNAIADGKSKNRFRVTVIDAHNNPVSGQSIKLKADKGATVAESVITEADGTVIVPVTSQQAGDTTVTASIHARDEKTLTLTFHPDQNTMRVEQNNLSILPEVSLADGKTPKNVTAKVTDAKGNAVPGVLVTFSTNNGATLAEETVKTDAQGVVTTTLVSTIAGTSRVMASINNLTTTKDTIFTGDNATAIVSSVSTDMASGVADGVTAVTFKALIKDLNGNLLSGIPVDWKSDKNSSIVSFNHAQTLTSKEGIAEVAVTSTRAYSDVVVTAFTNSSSASASPFVFNAGDVDESRSELALSPSVIVAGKETATLRLTLRDSKGNLLTGKTVSGISDNSDVNVGESQQNSNTRGRYTMVVSSDKAGTATLSVKVDGQTLNMSRILTVKGDNDRWKLSSIVSDKTSLTAGDGKGVTYHATVTDAQGNLLNNVVVSWQLSGQAESYEPTSRTNEKGVATTTVRSNTVGLLQMTAYLDADNYAQADGVTVVAGEIKNSIFGADKTNIGSDGKDTVTLTASLEDSYGNPVTGKILIIEGADSLAGFKLSAVQDQQNGRYVATGTATTKGKVTLNAKVDGKKVGDSVTVTVGAITPDLRFDNAEQPVTWTRNFTASQVVRGMPEDVEQQWSSSDRRVATVDQNGRVTLLKAGSARISVYTPGNEQYNQAMASYTLSVSKADPGLKAGTGDPITAIWADDKEQNITANYTNSDVQGGLTAVYTTKNTAIVTVDNIGKLTPVKPGTTTVTVSTPETDQFLAASVNVVYVLNKATADVSFTITTVKTTDEDAFTLQSPVTSLTPQASTKWVSSNTNVVSVSDSGTIQGNVGKGQTRLTLTVLANDYYNASSGYYDVMVYTKPSISLGNVSYISKGSKGSSGTWTPVFTDDSLSVTWSADVSDEFSKPESVTVYILDSYGNKLASIVEPSPAGSKTTIVDPSSSFWDKKVHVALVAKGFGKLETNKSSSEIIVRNLEPKQIWTSFTVRSQVRTMTSRGEDRSCRSTALGRDHWNNVVVTGDSVNFGGKTLISPMSMRARINASQNGSVFSNEYFPISHSTVRTNQNINFGTTRIAQNCWINHTGRYDISVIVDYNGSSYQYYGSGYGWGGNGDGMYVDRIDNF